MLARLLCLALGLAAWMPWNPRPQAGPGLCVTDMECCEIFRDC